MPNSLIVITGPTAVGKTDVAIKVAERYSSEIISSDSRQLYRELNKGTAKPNTEQLSAVKHHFINHLSIHDKYSAALFETEALEVIMSLLKNHRICVMTGGSGLYINAVCKGIDELPSGDEKIRSLLQEEINTKGLEYLQNKLAEVDPEFHVNGDIANPRRVMRALEVFQISGSTYSSLLKKKNKKRSFRIVKLLLERPREELYKRINTRVDAMMESGLLKEAENLYPFRSLNALQTVGYREIFKYLDKKIDLEEAIRLIKRNTRRYARTQISWFRQEKDVPVFHPADVQSIFAYIDRLI